MTSASSVLPVTSREYKVMLDPRLFADRSDGLTEVQRDIKRLGDRLGIQVSGKFGKLDQRTIRFLDTPDCTIRRNQLILRHRQSVEAGSQGEFTLKCRLEDRYLAVGKDLTPTTLKGTEKFEEDIAAPFLSRFSHSVSIPGSLDALPDSILAASDLFSILGQLPRDGAICNESTSLGVVGDFVPHEQSHKGLKLKLDSSVKCTIAVILWSHTAKSRVLCAEFSFRYGDENENYSLTASQSAYDLFAAIQKLNWCMPNAVTKTQFGYQQ